MYTCDICNYSTDNRQSYAAHRRVHSKTFKPFGNEYGEFKCEFCNNGVTYKSKNALTGHQAKCYEYLKYYYGIELFKDSSKYLFRFYWIKELDEYRSNIIKSKLDIDNLSIESITDSIEYFHKDSNYSDILTSYFTIIEIKKFFYNLYIKYTIPEISNMINIADSVVCRIFRYYGFDRLHLKSSKIHLNYKPTIENLLGYKTITEYGIGKFSVDEYCKELNLCIEFDGEWCHDKDWDNYRESIIKSNLGCDFIRIPIHKWGIDDNELINIVNSYLNNKLNVATK